MSKLTFVTVAPYVLFGVPMLLAFSDGYVYTGMLLLFMLIGWTIDLAYVKIKRHYHLTVSNEDIEKFFADQKKSKG